VEFRVSGVCSSASSSRLVGEDQREKKYNCKTETSHLMGRHEDGGLRDVAEIAILFGFCTARDG
jgi:hypothetical protein